MLAAVALLCCSPAVLADDADKVAAAAAESEAPAANADAKGGEEPKDDTVDWLLEQGSEAAPTPKADGDPAKPAPGKGGEDPSPFVGKKDDKHVRRGVITLSNGEQVRGRVSTTRGKPLRVWEEKKKRYRDVPFFLVKSAAAEVVWERDEREWHFKESGSDTKEYSGNTYPARELRYTLTLLNGQTISGGVVAPLYVERKDDDPATFVLHKRTKGEVGETLADLVYVTRVEFGGKPLKAGGKAPKAKGEKGATEAPAQDKPDGKDAATKPQKAGNH
jgi:hypothetical protein